MAFFINLDFLTVSNYCRCEFLKTSLIREKILLSSFRANQKKRNQFSEQSKSPAFWRSFEGNCRHVMYKLQENEEGNEADQTAMDDGAAEAGNADDVATNYAETEVLLCETSRAVSSTSDVRPRENLSATAGSDGATAAETTPDAQFGTRKRFGTGFSQYCKRF